MSRSLSTRRAALCVSWAVGLAACEGGVGQKAFGAFPEGAALASIRVSPSSATLTVIGETQQFTATASDSSGLPVTGVSFTWSSTDTTVVTVDSTGTARAVGDGTAGVSATASGISGTASVAVSAPSVRRFILPAHRN